jgi:hypothetical protein
MLPTTRIKRFGTLSGTQTDYPSELQSVETQFKAKQVELVEGESQNIMPLEKLNWLMSAAAVGQLARIRKGVEDQVCEGWVQNFNLIVNDAEPSQEIEVDRPAQSLFIVNDGLGQILVEINERFTTQTTLNRTETLRLDFKGHKLRRFFVQCPLGQAATGRAIAKG